MPESSMKRKFHFTIFHGLAASLLIHSLFALPFVLHALMPPPEEPRTLDLELDAAVSNVQTEERIQKQTKGEAQPEEDKKPDETPPPKPLETAAAPPEDRPVEPLDDKEGPPPPKQEKAEEEAPRAAQAGTSVADIAGTEQQQAAQAIKQAREAEIDRMRAYVKLLSKKVQTNLVYPDGGRQAGLQGAATVSFAILRNGQIRPETLKIVESSGQPKLDASALKTVRSSVPFDPPPREMTVAIAVAYGRKP